MIDFSRKPSPKSESEIAFDELSKEYESLFGKPYVFSIGIDGSSWEEVLADIRRRIAENDPQPSPDYEPDTIY